MIKISQTTGLNSEAILALYLIVIHILEHEILLVRVGKKQCLCHIGFIYEL